MTAININFNLPFDEAIQQMANRGVVLPEVYYGKLQGIHRQLAFSIANIAEVDQLQAVLDSLTNHLKNGGTFASWQKNVDVKALGLPRHRLDNIFRTNIQQAYNHGHWQQALANQATHGYLMYDAINDSRTRPSHKANDGIIRKIDDPIWKRIWFSRNVYRCRCRLISLTEKQAMDRSANGQGIYKTATEDPLRDKAWDSVDVMNADVLSFGVERAIADRMTAGKVDKVLLSAMDKELAKPLEPAKFIPAKTVKEAEQYLVDNDIVDFADFGKITDIALINDWNKALFDTVKEFPELRINQQFTGSQLANIEKLYNFECEKMRLSCISKGYTEEESIAAVKRNVKKLKPNGFAFSNPRDGAKGIAFNEVFEVDAARLMQQIAETEYWAQGSGTMKYVVDHELGHQLDNLLFLSEEKEIKSLYLKLKRSGTLKQELSGYASEQKIQDFIAECWAEYRNNPTPRNTAKTVGELIVKRYRDRFINTERT
jgi:SPP1 gp7 family putative phage head morphogenesis protein